MGTPLPSQNQEKFVLLLIQGKSQRAAYREAYPKCKALDNIVDSKASSLFAQEKVRARYNELMEEVLRPLKEESIATAREVLVELTNMGFGRKKYEAYDMNGNVYEAKPSIAQRQKALELLGKNHGLFTENVSLAGVAPVKIVDDLSEQSPKSEGEADGSETQ